jgi:hypothetical protein
MNMIRNFTVSTGTQLLHAGLFQQKHINCIKCNAINCMSWGLPSTVYQYKLHALCSICFVGLSDTFHDSENLECVSLLVSILCSLVTDY